MASHGWDWWESVGEKAPILVVGLLSGLVTTAYGHLANQTNLSAAMAAHPAGGIIVTIENVSISKTADYHVLQVLCVDGGKCLPEVVNYNVAGVIALKAHQPAIDRFNHPCEIDESYITFVVSLPPGGKVDVRIAAEPDEVSLSLSGKSADPPCARLVAMDTQLLMTSSPVHVVKATVLRNSMEIFVASFVALAITILIYVSKLFRRKQRVVKKRR